MWVYLLLAILKRTCWNKCLFSFLGKQIEKLSYFLTNRFIQPFFRKGDLLVFQFDIILYRIDEPSYVVTVHLSDDLLLCHWFDWIVFNVSECRNLD